MSYNWPGNIRELRNVVERSVVTCKDKVITQKILPAHITLMKNGGSSITLPIGISSREAERRFILQTLAEAGNNKTKTAQILGLSRKTLHNKLREFEVQ
jgi:two-component system NtrC family response regulator